MDTNTPNATPHDARSEFQGDSRRRQRSFPENIALSCAGTGQVIAKAHPAAAHPRAKPGRHPRDEREIRNVAIDDGARGNHGVFADGHTANDCRVRAYGRAAADKRWPNLSCPVDECPWIDHIREDCTWPAENIVFQRNSSINRDIVLNLATVTYTDIRSDHHILTYHTPLSQRGSAQYVAEMPHFRISTYRHVRIDDGRGMNEIAIVACHVVWRFRRCAQ
jgi:hypothetical protein